MSTTPPAAPPAPRLAIDTAGPIRSFLNSGVQADLQKAVASLPEGHSTAVIVEVNKAKAQAFVVAGRGDWTVCGALAKRFDTRGWAGVDGQFAVMWSK